MKRKAGEAAGKAARQRIQRLRTRRIERRGDD